VARGDVLADPRADLAPAYVVDAALDLVERLEHGARVTVHHGTREAPARLAALGGRYWQLRLERPLVAAAGDRLVVRRIAPPDTLGGGLVLDPGARKHGPGRDVLARLVRLERGEPEPPPAPTPEPPAPAPQPAPLSATATALEERLRAAGHEPPIASELSEAEAAELPALRAAGRAVRVGRNLHYHPEALADIERRVVARIEAGGSITLAELRDELGTSRKFAQALLEHFDSEKLTRRLPDDRRVLRRR
jgi:selenocysteine-specific elongation factor